MVTVSQNVECFNTPFVTQKSISSQVVIMMTLETKYSQLSRVNAQINHETMILHTIQKTHKYKHRDTQCVPMSFHCNTNTSLLIHPHYSVQHSFCSNVYIIWSCQLADCGSFFNTLCFETSIHDAWAEDVVQKYTQTHN